MIAALGLRMPMAMRSTVGSASNPLALAIPAQLQGIQNPEALLQPQLAHQCVADAKPNRSMG